MLHEAAGKVVHQVVTAEVPCTSSQCSSSLPWGLLYCSKSNGEPQCASKRVSAAFAAANSALVFTSLGDGIFWGSNPIQTGNHMLLLLLLLPLQVAC
jgi:hypothetical protein